MLGLWLNELSEADGMSMIQVTASRGDLYRSFERSHDAVALDDLDGRKGIVMV